jgi:hypothetical protein
LPGHQDYQIKDYQDQIYPKEIKYTYHENASPYYTVQFHLEDRDDHFISCDGHFEVNNRKRLSIIQVKGSNKNVRAYGLRYINSDVTHLSMLAGVTEYGQPTSVRPHNGTIVGAHLPEKTFTYRSEGNSFGSINSKVFKWTRNSNVNMELFKGIGDFNGDGKADIWRIQHKQTPDRILIYLADEQGFGEAQDWGFTNNWPNEYWRGFQDFNGDGMLDLWYVPNNSTRKIFVRLSTGSNFADPQEWGANNLWANHYWVRFSDLNGDGMQDLWYVRAWSGTVTVRLSNGNGFDAPVDWGSGNNWANYIWTGFEDFNGDGKQDFWFVSANATTVLKVRLSTGTSLGPILEWGTDNNWANHLWRGFADFNGDGKQDLWFVPSGSHILHVRLSDGERLADAIEWTDGDNWVGYDNKGFADINGDGKMDLWYQDASNGHVMVRFSTGQGMTEAMTLSNGNYSFVAGDWKGFADFNGDGSADLWAVPGETLNSGTAYQYTTILNRLYWVYSNSQAPGYVTQIDNGIGATTQFRYDTHFSHPLKVQTVISKTVNDGLSPSAQYCYNYENGYYSFEDRAFRGFEHTYKTNPDGAIEKATIEVDDYWFKGRVLTKTLSSDSALLSQITYRWAASGDPSDDWRFIWPDEKRTEFFDGEIVYSQENFTYDPINGNLSSKTIQGREGPTIRTSYSYVNKGDWLWKNTQKTVYEWDSASSSWVTQAATAYGYESGTGNLTDAWNWLAGWLEELIRIFSFSTTPTETLLSSRMQWATPPQPPTIRCAMLTPYPRPIPWAMSRKTSS